MKKMFTLLICGLALFSRAQFVAQPLNYPEPGYWPYYISITDPQHVWVGTFHENGNPYSTAIHTRNGGSSWIFNPIPVTGYPICASISAIDSNTCFYVFIDGNVGEGSIWKTTNEGVSWTNMTTTQFSGGFANFYHAFSADTGVAMGDPVGGYYEIELTNNGGISWLRLPQSRIPAPLSNEYGLNDCYSAVGNSIWFVTNMGRCFRSSDRGLNWQVSQVFPANDESFNICFATEQNGACWRTDSNTGEYAVTMNGGATWENRTFMPGYLLINMCRVKGFDQGFAITAWKNSTSVYFTPDMFETFQVLGQDLLSSGAVDFLNASTGWISGGESGNNEILKFTGLITNTIQDPNIFKDFSLSPNPTSGPCILRLQDNIGAGITEIRICSMIGDFVRRVPFTIKAGTVELDVSTFEDGIYLIQLLNTGKIEACRKLIVIR